MYLNRRPDDPPRNRICPFPPYSALSACSAVKSFTDKAGAAFAGRESSPVRARGRRSTLQPAQCPLRTLRIGLHVEGLHLRRITMHHHRLIELRRKISLIGRAKVAAPLE